MSQVLITGSEGTIGKKLYERLAIEGHGVDTVDITHTARKNHMRADVADYRQLYEAFAKFEPEYVYHLAAEFGRVNGERYYEQVWRSNVIGTKNVLELQRDFDFKLIFASSSEVYGENPDDEIVEEDVEPGAPAPKLTNDYAISKWVNEQQIMNAEEQWDNQVMRLRFFNAYGPGEYYTPYRSVVCLFSYLALHSLPFDVYDQYYRTFMYISDFIPTLAAAVPRFSSREVVNIGGSDYRSVAELAEIILDYTGRSKSLARLKGAEEHNTASKRPNIDRAEQLFGHNPKVTLEDGVPDTIEWMKEVYGF